MNDSRPADFIHEVTGEFNDVASVPLTNQNFMKPVNHNFFAINYMQRWDAKNGKKNVQVVLLVQNKLMSDPSQMSVAIKKMRRAINALLLQNSAVIFIPVFFTLVKNVDEIIATSLTNHFRDG